MATPASWKTELKFRWLEIKNFFLTKIWPKIVVIRNGLSILAKIKRYIRLITFAVVIIALLALIAIFGKAIYSNDKSKFSGCNCNSEPSVSDAGVPVKIDPESNVPKVERTRFPIDPDVGVEVEPEIKKKTHVLGESAEAFWKVVLIQGGKKGKQVEPATIDRWKAELQLMRYRCNSYYNERVEVNCWRDEDFCDVSFVSIIGINEYRMYYRSAIASNGYDKIIDWKVYSLKPGVIGKMTIQDRVNLIDQIIQARPNCNPFNTK